MRSYEMSLRKKVTAAALTAVISIAPVASTATGVFADTDDMPAPMPIAQMMRDAAGHLLDHEGNVPEPGTGPAPAEMQQQENGEMPADMQLPEGAEMNGQTDNGGEAGMQKPGRFGGVFKQYLDHAGNVPAPGEGPAPGSGPVPATVKDADSSTAPADAQAPENGEAPQDMPKDKAPQGDTQHGNAPQDMPKDNGTDGQQSAAPVDHEGNTPAPGSGPAPGNGPAPANGQAPVSGQGGSAQK